MSAGRTPTARSTSPPDHSTQPAADQPALPLDGYNDLAAATAITTPVLLSAGDPDQEAQLRDRLTGQRLVVPVATSNPACGSPTDPIWLPTSSPTGGRRYRLGALGHSNPWHLTRPAAAATPAPRTTDSAGPPHPVEDPAGSR
jgi:hypothetical protein